MGDFEHWTEISKGYYRYVTAANVCYELMLVYRNLNSDILNATARLYVTGDWIDNETHVSFFSREELYCGAVSKCIEKALKDDEDNNNENEIV